MMKIINFFKNLLGKKFDRNYHHYTMTDHCRTRMKERKIYYKDINLAFKYGRIVDKQIILDISNIPVYEFNNMKPSLIRHVIKNLPLVITIKPNTNIITTVYKGNNSIRTKQDLKMMQDFLNPQKEIIK